MGSTLLYGRMTMRRKMASLMVVLFLIVVTILLQLYPRLIEASRSELEFIYDSLEVSGWLVNTQGFEEPSLPVETWHAMLDLGYIGEQHSYSLLKAYVPDTFELEMRWEGLPEEEQARLESYIKLADTAFPDLSKGVAVTDVLAQGDLYRQLEEVQWLEGYDAACLESMENICLLPSYLGHQPGDLVPVILQPHHISKESNHLVIMVKVVGVYPNRLSSGGELILPIGHYEQLCREKPWQLYIHNMDFTVADNRTLLDCKKALLALGLGAEESTVRVSIDDRVFEGTAAPVRSNLELLEALYRFFFVAVIAIGFFLCFLLARGRKPEYAVMRLLGESTTQVTVKALLEQMILCACGIVLGILILMSFGQGSLNAVTCGIILVCYTLGATLAVLLTVRVNVMEILRDKE